MYPTPLYRDDLIDFNSGLGNTWSRTLCVNALSDSPQGSCMTCSRRASVWSMMACTMLMAPVVRRFVV